MIVSLIIYGVVVFVITPLRRSITWIHIGGFDFHSKLLTALTIAMSSIALVIWYLATIPDLRAHLALMPELPIWALPVLGIGFAFINAAMEEVIFRGIMMEALDSAIGIGYTSVVIQAFAFGAFHCQAGFPNGSWGFVMTLVYGFMLGMIRRQSQGMMAPWVTHVGADITIFVILVTIY